MCYTLYMERDDSYNPLSLFRLRVIEHYYGDYVRQLFVLCAVLFIVSVPLWGYVLPLGALAEVAAAVLLVLLAGMTSPHSKMALRYDAAAAALGVFLVEVAALSLYTGDVTVLFVIRQLIAVLLLIAFYFSVKTLRAMAQGKIGQRQQLGEFDS